MSKSWIIIIVYTIYSYSFKFLLHNTQHVSLFYYFPALNSTTNRVLMNVKLIIEAYSVIIIMSRDS